jgi:hypothetical protein
LSRKDNGIYFAIQSECFRRLFSCVRRSSLQGLRDGCMFGETKQSYNDHQN